MTLLLLAVVVMKVSCRLGVTCALAIKMHTTSPYHNPLEQCLYNKTHRNGGND